MKIYLKIVFWTSVLFALYGSYILALGKPLAVSEEMKTATDLKSSYLPFFKLAICGFVFSALFRFYIDFKERKNKPNN